jgi:hypothetical protein
MKNPFESRQCIRYGCPLMSCLALTTMMTPVVAQAQAPPSSNYTLAWSDSFPGTAIDPTKWMTRMGYDTSSNDHSVQMAANDILSSGTLQIEGLSQPGFIGSENYTGGGLMSLATFRFGYFQVTATTPPVTVGGWHTTFWLSGGFDSDESWNPVPQTAYTEIDGLQVNSANPTVTETDWIGWNGSTQTTKLCSYSRTSNYFTLTNAAGTAVNTSTASHIYGIEWTESTINYFVDGHEFCSQPYLPSQYAASPVNILLTSVADGSDDIGTPSTATFSNPQYYVRDYYVNPEDTGYAEYGNDWANSSMAGFSFQPVRYGCNAGDTVTYTPGLLAAGNYDVQVYAIVGSGTDTATAVTMNTSAGPQSGSALPSTGASGWVDEGTYSFNAGDTSSVTLARGNNCLQTSMVKFLRQ